MAGGLVSFPVAVIQYSDKSNLRVNLQFSFQGTVCRGAEVKTVGKETAARVCLQSSHREWGMPVLLRPLSTETEQDRSQGMLPRTVGRSSHSS